MPEYMGDALIELRDDILNRVAEDIRRLTDLVYGVEKRIGDRIEQAERAREIGSVAQGVVLETVVPETVQGNFFSSLRKRLWIEAGLSGVGLGAMAYSIYRVAQMLGWP